MVFFTILLDYLSTITATVNLYWDVFLQDLDRLTVDWPEIRGLSSHRETYEDMEDDCNSRLTALTTRSHRFHKSQPLFCSLPWNLNKIYSNSALLL